MNVSCCNVTFGADERKVVVAYQNLLHLLEVIDTDNISILKELICPKDDPQPLFDGATHKRVSPSSHLLLPRKHLVIATF